jgi:hypothetical protein
VKSNKEKNKKEGVKFARKLLLLTHGETGIGFAFPLMIDY